MPEGGADSSAARVGQRSVWFSGGGAVAAAVFDRERLLAVNVLRGPALVLQLDATTVVPPGWRGVVDAWGNLVLEKE
jgi:N-methylhydantoinase A